MNNFSNIQSYAIGTVLLVGLLPAGLAQSVPYAFTQPASPVAAASATLNGMATPNGNPSVSWFEWGTNNVYSQQTAATDVGAGNSVVRVSAAIAGLVPGSDYLCRLVVSNSAGVTHGAAHAFTTGRKVALWQNSATNWPATLTNAVAIAGGNGSHFLAIRNDGTIAAWGSNTYGESSVPADLTNVVAVSCGSRHSVALKPDGTVVAWGVSSVVGETAVPAGLSNVVAIATGNGHNLALVGNGTVVAWGENEFGQANVPSGLSNVVAVACGGWFSLALRNDGTLTGWGFDANGPLNFPVTLTNVVAIAAGLELTVALQADGTVWALGLMGMAGGWQMVNFNDALTGPGNTRAIAAQGVDVIMLGSDGWVTNSAGTTVAPGLSNVVAISAGWLALAPNVAPQTVSQTVSGLPDSDLPLTLTASDVNGDPLTLRISSLPTAGTLYQFNNGVRGPAITLTDTVVSNTAGRLIFAPATNGFGIPYASFSFIANDGLLDSGPGMVTVQLAGAAYAMSLPATLIGTNDATLNGVATPQGLATAAWFEWGTNDSYRFTTDPVDLGGGTNMVRLTAVISNLTVAGIYHCRLVASNAVGSTCGADQLFTTGRNCTQFPSGVPPSGINGVTAISAGTSYNLALRNDGIVLAWGSLATVTNIPPGISNIMQISAGGNHCLALRSDGWIYGWGDNSSYQLVYANCGSCGWISNVIAVAAGGAHSLALKNNGTVVGWGNWTICSPPAGLSNVVAIAAGGSQSLALKNDGTVVGWGDNGWGQAIPPAGLSNVVAIAAGGQHSLALQRDGTIVGWGFNYYGQATAPTDASNVVAIAAGDYHSVALRRDGTVVVWGGQNSVPADLTNVVAIAARGQSLAIGNLPPAVSPVTVSGPANYDLLVTLSRSDANGDPTTLRLASMPASGVLYQYDSGSRGAAITAVDTVIADPQGRLLFAPDTNSYGVSTFNYVANDGWVDSAPAQVTLTITATTRAVTALPTVLNPSNAVLNGWATGGGLPAIAWFEWGTNSAYGQKTAAGNLDIGLTGTLLSTPVASLAPGGEYHFRLVVSNAASVAYGGEKIFTTGRSIWAWGGNAWGQGTVPDGLGPALAVAAGRDYNLALLTDTTVAGWGRNDAGQASPPAGLSNVTAVAAGLAHSVALLADGTMVAWGTNNYGQTNVPAGLANVVAMAAGANHSLALCNDGSVVGWGSNNLGQTNTPAGLSNVVAVAAGFSHSLALKLDGTVISWGGGASSLPAGLTNVIAIAAAGVHSLALTANGKVTAWGPTTTYGENTVPTSLSNVVAIAAGTNHNIAVLRDGSVFFWGRNDLGQASPPPGLSNCLAVAGGDLHSLALAPVGALWPFASTLPATQVRSASAVLNGMATPNGSGARAWFEWSTNLSYNRTTPALTLPDGNAVQLVSLSLSNLTPYAGYRCRLVVSNANGITRGLGRPFTTGGRVNAASGYTCLQTNVPVNLNGVVAVSAGAGHVLSLLNDGTVMAWGTNTSGQATVPATLADVFAVAAGGSHSLALKADGTVTAWGRNNEGQTNVPATLSNVVAVAAGDKHSLALKADGTVVAWGSNSNGQANVPPGLSNVVAIAAGGDYSMALRHDGIGVAWGILTGNYGDKLIAGFPANLNTVAGIAAGVANACLIKRDGTAMVLGDSYFNQANLPAGTTNIVAMAAGLRHILALKADGRFTNSGDGYAVMGLTSFTNVFAVSAGAGYSVALVSGGLLAPRATTLSPAAGSNQVTLKGAVRPNNLSAAAWFQWGTNGTFTQTTAVVPLNATGLTVWASASVSNLVPGGIYSCRLVASNFAGTVYGAEQRFTTGRKIIVWGNNSSGQTNIPPGLSNVVAVAGGQSHSVALKSDGTVAAWGASLLNQTAVPASATNVVAVAAGLNHTLALRSNGSVVGWGANGSGQTNVPSSASNVVVIACGENHSLALRADGKVIAWGANSYGQAAVPAGLADAVAIAGGNRHSLALKSDGSLTAWGDSGWGQTNMPASATNVIAIAAGDLYSLALKADGSVVVWGDANSPPSGTTGVMAIAAGYNYSLALKTNGALVGWGNNSYGQSTPPAGADNITGIAAGQYHSLIVGPNYPPEAIPQIVSGPANHNLLLNLSASDPNGDPVSFRVATLPAPGTLYQYAAGIPGDLISSNGTPVTDPAGRLVFVPAVNTSGSPYAGFMFVAGDGEADSAATSFTLNIAAPIAPLFANLAFDANGAFQITYTGDANTTYCVWASTNLFDWQYIGPGTPTSPGEFLFVDAATTNAPARFYRLSTECGP